MKQTIGKLVQWTGFTVYNSIEDLGRMVILLVRAIRAAGMRPWRWQTILEQLEFVGVQSSFIVLLTGLFTGMVFALQSSYAFRLFGAESLIGPSVTLSLVRELGPVLTAIMVTARAGSAMATELGTMRVTEQIDALYTMGINPVQYLVLPRLLAGTLMVPMLTLLFSFIGFWGSYFVTITIVGMGPNVYLQGVLDLLKLDDLFNGLFKSAVFGLLLSLISCSEGFHARGGARGVGEATTRAVVLSCVIILVSDYFLTAWLWG